MQDDSLIKKEVLLQLEVILMYNKSQGNLMSSGEPLEASLSIVFGLQLMTYHEEGISDPKTPPAGWAVREG